MSGIAHRRSITERPGDVAGRASPGHWEADYMLFSQYGQGLLVAHERHSRYTLLDHPPDRKAERTARRSRPMAFSMPPFCQGEWTLGRDYHD